MSPQGLLSAVRNFSVCRIKGSGSRTVSRSATFQALPAAEKAYSWIPIAKPCRRRRGRVPDRLLSPETRAELVARQSISLPIIGSAPRRRARLAASLVTQAAAEVQWCSGRRRLDTPGWRLLRYVGGPYQCPWGWRKVRRRASPIRLGGIQASLTASRVRGLDAAGPGLGIEEMVQVTDVGRCWWHDTDSRLRFGLANQPSSSPPREIHWPPQPSKSS